VELYEMSEVCCKACPKSSPTSKQFVAEAFKRYRSKAATLNINPAAYSKVTGSLKALLALAFFGMPTSGHG
jgi:hypothetical protein